MPVIKFSQLADEVNKICELYVEEVDKETDKAIRAAANETRKDLSGYKSKRGFGKYGASWHVSVEKSALLGISAVVHSSMPGLPHLIEFGHGGPQPAPPHPHMDRAYQAGYNELMKRLGK